MTIQVKPAPDVGEGAFRVLVHDQYERPVGMHLFKRGNGGERAANQFAARLRESDGTP